VAGLETNGFQVGRLIDERVDQPGSGDFLVRSVVGVDHRSGAVAVDDRMPLGATIRFHLRDAGTARQDLRGLLADRRANGVLMFTCSGRGTRFFDEADHDAGLVAEQLGPVAVGGFFAAGEIGPIGGTNFVHSFTASMALFRDH
jgi:small ligand-binding sensory domain FIST